MNQSHSDCTKENHALITTRMNSITNKTYSLFYFVTFFFMLMEARCWIGFGLKFFLPFIVFAVLVLLGITGNVRYQFKARYVVFAFLFLISTWLSGRVWTQNNNGYIVGTMPSINILMLLSLADEYKDDLLSHWVRWFGYMMAISLALYGITIFVDLPGLGIVYADYGEGAILDYPYQNYLFFIKSLSGTSDLGFNRFNGPFIEPGDLGCICAFWLIAARYDFKKYKGLKIVAISLFASLSLAGWFLAIVGFVLHLFEENRVKGSQLSFILFILIGVYLFGSFYNNGDNFINNAIFSRLESDDDTGFSGNNRTSLIKLAYFYDMWDKPDVLFMGYDAGTIKALNDEKGSGAGFVSLFVSIGLIGVIATLLPFIVFSMTSYAKKYAWFFFALFCMYFFQRTDMWIAYLIPFVYGIVINERGKYSV